MRPYIAVIADSFRSALSSRVLWAAFIANWVFLGALAPIGYRQDYTTEFRWIDLDNGTQMKAMLARGLVDPAENETALGRLAGAMPDDLKRQLRRVGQGDEVRIRKDVLSAALNEAMQDESWYDAEAWKKTPRLRELRELDAKSTGELSDSLRLRRARLRIESALPGVFEARSARSVTLSYAGIDFPAVFAVDKNQFAEIANQFVMPLMMNWLLGFVLIFLGILVTASIVPDMLQPGSLHLLLSKPISRTLLLLSKFIGGCAFVLLCVCQLVLGLWLIAGLRLDIWNTRLLWCIPVSVFLFSVFFSVSVLAGLRWRSPILAIGVSCIFGGILLVIGILGTYFDNWVTLPDRIRGIAYADSTLIAASRGGGLLGFDREANAWSELLNTDSSRRDLILAPTRLDAEHILTARVRGGRFNPYGSGSLDLLLLSKHENWQPEPSLRLPIATTRLYPLRSRHVVAANSGGLAITSRDKILTAAGRLEADNADAENRVEPESDSLASRLANLLRMQGVGAANFQPILPSDIALVQPARVAVADGGNALVLYSRGRIVRLQPAGDAQTSSSGDMQKPWTITADRSFDGDPSQSTVLASSGDRLLIVRSEESPQLLDSDNLQTVAQLPDPAYGQTIVKASDVNNDGRFIIVTSDGSCHVIDGPGSTENLGQKLDFSEVEVVSADPISGKLMVVHHIDQVDVLDAKTLQVTEQIRPTLAGWRAVDRYVITPLRTITPQTGELGQTVAAIVGGKSTVAINRNATDEGDIIRFRILRPLLSCAAFIACMLLIGSIYFARKDF